MFAHVIWGEQSPFMIFLLMLYARHDIVFFRLICRLMNTRIINNSLVKWLLSTRVTSGRSYDAPYVQVEEHAKIIASFQRAVSAGGKYRGIFRMRPLRDPLSIGRVPHGLTKRKVFML